MAGSTRELVYRFSVAGKAETLAAFDTINERAKKLAGEEAALVERAEDRKTKARKRGADDALKAELQTVADVTKADRAATAAKEASARKAVTDAKRASNEIVAEAVKEHRSILESKKRALAEQTKAEKEAIREASKAQKQLVDEQKKYFNDSLRAQSQAKEHARREEESKSRLNQRQFDRARRDEMFDRKRLYRSFGTGVAESAIGVVGMGMNVATRAGASVLRGAGLDKAYDVGDIVREKLSLGTRLKAIAVESRGTIDEKRALADIAKASAATGFSQDEFGAALDIGSEKGKGAEIAGSIGRIGTEARALNVSPEVVAKIRAQMMVSADATGKQVTEADLQKAIAMFADIGKTGVFRAGDIAEQSESLLSRYAAGGGDFQLGLARFTAFANEARKSTGSGAVARTSINAIQDAVRKKRDKIQQLGVDTMRKDSAGNEVERDFIDVVEDVISKTGGGHDKIHGDALYKIFDPARSGKAMQTMLTAYNSAGGGKRGSFAMEEVLQKGMGDASSIGADSIDKDASTMMQDEGLKLAAAMQSIRTSIGEAITPALEKLAAKMPAIVESITSLIDWVQKNPTLAVLTGLSTGTLAGLAKPAARHVGGGALRYVGDRLANSQFGGKAGVLARGVGMAAGFAANEASSIGSIPVFVTGVAAGVSLGGGGGGDPSSLLGGVGAAEGAAGIAGAAMGVIGVVLASVAIGELVSMALDKLIGNKSIYNSDELGDRHLGSTRAATDKDATAIADIQAEHEARKVGMIDDLTGMTADQREEQDAKIRDSILRDVASGNSAGRASNPIRDAMLGDADKSLGPTLVGDDGKPVDTSALQKAVDDQVLAIQKSSIAIEELHTALKGGSGNGSLVIPSPTDRGQ